MRKYVAALAVMFMSHAAFAMDTEAKQAIVVDDSTNTVLFEKNADERMHPSSMSKLMTVYIAFSRLKDGSLKLTDMLPVSEKAWRVQGSKMFVELGNRISVEDLLQGIIVQSGNDACMVMAEGLAGSEEGFVAQMNDMAKKLGLTNSHFANPDGLSDPNHLMSARDLATLAHHIIHDFPEYYHYFSEKEFEYHHIKQGNRNLLLYKNTGFDVDGLKTGHTDEGGYGMVSSGKDSAGRRVIVVVNGLSNIRIRGEESERLLDFGFRDFTDVKAFKAGDVIEKANVWFGEQEQVGLTTAQDLELTLPKAGRDNVKFTITYDDNIPAPVTKGDHVADLKITLPSGSVKVVPLVAAESVDKLHGFHRITRALMYYVSGK
ncbi:MAG TPA: D-alanyl-D-alanine carboxypeptidase family protein [Rickettsiales bacterium]|nr:D-alanyl-D-alanine carboxypeptidase family protein [Rickettsiales bacterium]